MILSLLLITLLTPVQPMGLPWGAKISQDFREVKDFKYLYGDVGWGTMRFLGEIGEMETGLLLHFSSRYIYEATLIFGPSSINEDNCIQQYKFFEGLLSKKYGMTFTKVMRTDPVIDDLLYVRRCYPIKLGIEEVVTTWRTTEFKVELALFGDDELFIEITYQYLAHWRKAKKMGGQKLLKRF